ncbi:MAG: prolyl oligopeptidase family serine peptidase, partial [Phycisphaerales bacterium JB059]
MRRVLVLALFSIMPLFCATHARAQSPTPGFHFVEVQSEEGPVKGTIYVPRDLDRSRPAPTLVFLHGYGECGTDGSRNLGVGLPNALLWDADRWPFVIVMPQKPVFDTDWDTYDEAVMRMLDLAIAEFGADPQRVGITGLSQGGHGTIALATAHPDRFRAAAPVCGYTKLRFTGEGERVSFDEPTPPEQFAEAAEAMS